MNNHRTSNYIYIIASLCLTFIFATLTFCSYLNNNVDVLSHPFFVASLSLYLIFSATSMVTAWLHYLKTDKVYKYQFEKYQDKFILSNRKRELSSLLMVVCSAWMLYPLFPMINAYLKSGLCDKKREIAKQHIRIKHVDDFLKQKDVIDHLKENPEENRIIKGALKLREKGRDIEYNCNLYILKTLNKIHAPYEVIYDEYEVYLIGMNS